MPINNVFDCLPCPQVFSNIFHRLIVRFMTFDLQSAWLIYYSFHKLLILEIYPLSFPFFMHIIYWQTSSYQRLRFLKVKSLTYFCIRRFYVNQFVQQNLIVSVNFFRSSFLTKLMSSSFSDS